jgi:hypothetical protein
MPERCVWRCYWGRLPVTVLPARTFAQSSAAPVQAGYHSADRGAI